LIGAQCSDSRQLAAVVNYALMEAVMLARRCQIGLLATLVVMLAAPTVANHGAQATALLPPTAVLHMVNTELAQGDRARQGEIVRPMIALARTSSLHPAEELALAEILFLALNPKDSDAIFVKHLDRTDGLGRMAWIRHQQIQFRAFDRHAETESAIAEFRTRFPVSHLDLTYTSSMVANQAARYATAGDHATVVRLVLDDVAALPQDVPLRSFRLLGTFFGSFKAAGRAEEARAILMAHRARLQERVDKAGAALIAASALARNNYPHRPGHLHVDWDTGNADDDPAFDRERFIAQMALDRIKELDQMLQGKVPSGW
jgi:hypothetical protein